MSNAIKSEVRSPKCESNRRPSTCTAGCGLRSSFRAGLFTLLLGLALPSARAVIPEPDNLIYGLVQLGLTPVTAAQTNVVIEARKTSTNGPVVASYRMGESELAGDFYSLRIPLEAFTPLTDTNASRVGGLLYLSVRDDSGVRVRRTASIAARGKLVRLDFTEPDSDGDGLPDWWELLYFGSTTGADPHADPDGDGSTNLQEYLAGTNPLVPDIRHPADNSPANNILTLAEADAYANAWLAGTPWPGSPTNIPIAYVTKAWLLAMEGGAYIFTNSPPTNAPHGWVNFPLVPATPAGSNAVVCTFPQIAPPDEPLTVTLFSMPHAGVRVHAVEDRVPGGWEVSAISHGGSYDAANRKVKWGPFDDAGERELTYTVLPSPTNLIESFVGTGSYDGVNVPISGSRLVAIAIGGLPFRFTAMATDADGPAFLLTGLASHAYVIEVSTDLTHWTPLETITLDSAGRYLLRPAGYLAQPHQFYRARQP